MKFQSLKLARLQNSCFFLGAKRRKRGCARASHSFQTFRSKTARIRMADQQKKYDCFAVYKLAYKAFKSYYLGAYICL